MACGYLHETKTSKAWIYFSMNNVELNTYDVKVYFHNNSPRIWEVAEGIAEARKMYIKFCKQYGNVKPAIRLKKTYEPSEMPAQVYA